MMLTAAVLVLALGQVIPVIKYSDVDDAMDRANATEYGLGGSVWTNDLVEGEKRIGELESGNTWLNAHLVDVMAPHAPFGGIRTSVSPRSSSFPPPSCSSAPPDELPFLDPLLLPLHQDLI